MLQQGITYDTTMDLAAGAIMLLMVVFARVVHRPQRNSLEGRAWMFIAVGLILASTGTHMSLTWPLRQIEGAPRCAVDNVAFGEPAMLFGFLVVFAGIRHVGPSAPGRAHRATEGRLDHREVLRRPAPTPSPASPP
jgi:dipeptide/tripeptide permease